MLCGIEAGATIVSIPIAVGRGSMSKVSAGLNGLLIFVALGGLIGALRLKPAYCTLHSVLAIGVSSPACRTVSVTDTCVYGNLSSPQIPTVFGLFFLFTLTLSQGTRDADEGIIVAIYLSLIFDFLAGVPTGVVAWKLSAYEKLHISSTGTTPIEPPTLTIAVLPTATTSTEAAQAQLLQAAGLRELYAGGASVIAPNVGTRAAGRVLARHGINQQGPGRVEAGKSDEDPAPVMSAAAAGTFVTTMECAICMDNQRNSAFYDCGHLCCCYFCATGVQQGTGKCPVCRKRIVAVLRIYP
jgi:hypothetical protein